MAIQNNKVLTPLLLFLLSFLLRLSLISKGPFSVDCLTLAMHAKETLATGQLHHQYGFGYPLTVLLGALFIFLTSPFPTMDAVFAVNVMSVVFSSLCIIANYYLVKKLLNEITALFSSLFLSVYPMFLGLSVFGTSHTPSIFFLLLGLWFLLIGKEKNLTSYFLYAGVALGLMGAARLQDMVLMAIPVSFFYFWGMDAPVKTEGRLKHYCIFLISAAVTAFIFHLPLIKGQGQHHFDSQLSEFVKSGLTNNFRGLLSPSLPVGLKHIAASLSPVGVYCAIVGLYMLLKKKWRTFGFLFLWFAVPFLFYGNLWTTAPRFLLISSIPLIMAEGYFLSQVVGINKSFKLIALVAYFLIFFISLGTICPILKFRHHHALFPDFAKWVSLNTEPNALIISSDDNIFIEYYGHRKILARPYPIAWNDALDEGSLQDFKETLDKILDEKIPIYITGSGLNSYNPQNQFSDFIENHFTLSTIGKELTEDWHQGETTQRTGAVRLIKISKKQIPSPHFSPMHEKPE